MRCLVLLLLLMVAVDTPADSFRCGTRLVLTGDPVTRLTRACGQPEQTYKGRVQTGQRGNGKLATVSQWVYKRGGRRAIIVSVKDGVVVKISRD